MNFPLIKRFAILAVFLFIGTVSLAGSGDLFIENLTWPEVRDAIASGKTVAIYYAGSTEQNGPHMALGKHNFIAHYLAGEIANWEMLWYIPRCPSRLREMQKKRLPTCGFREVSPYPTNPLERWHARLA